MGEGNGGQLLCSSITHSSSGKDIQLGIRHADYRRGTTLQGVTGGDIITSSDLVFACFNYEHFYWLTFYNLLFKFSKKNHKNTFILAVLGRTSKKTHFMLCREIWEFGNVLGYIEIRIVRPFNIDCLNEILFSFSIAHKIIGQFCFISSRDTSDLFPQKNELELKTHRRWNRSDRGAVVPIFRQGAPYISPDVANLR